MKINNIVPLFLLLFSPVLIAHPESVEQMKNVLSARDAGQNNLINLILLITTLLSFVLGSIGWIIFKEIKAKLLEETKSKILENESRNLIRLGIRDFENYIYSLSIKDNSNAIGSLLSARSHTQQARYMAVSMPDPLTYSPKVDLLALSGTSLAYFYVELMRMVEKKEPKLSKKYRDLALDALNKASVHVSSCIKRQAAVDCDWWSVYESSLHVQYWCLVSKDDYDEAEKTNILKQVNTLIYHADIPQDERLEISDDWSELLKNGDGDLDKA